MKTAVGNADGLTGLLLKRYLGQTDRKSAVFLLHGLDPTTITIQSIGREPLAGSPSQCHSLGTLWA